MKPTLSTAFCYRLTFIILLCMCLSQFGAYAQTPGLIYRPATNGGNKVLDPNGDGYVSKTTAGWAVNTQDEGLGFSEITYRPFPAMDNEPLNDLTTGSNGGHTDLAPPVSYTGSTGSPIAAFYDGTNVLFRVRLGGASTASKGYSVLIDTNDNFENPERGHTPTSTVNPGFEFEAVFGSNFDVALYDHRTPNVVTKIWSGSVDQYSQRSVAASTASGNTDYFYDFYVPLSAFPGVTADTQLRMSGITITSAQSGLTGTVSDIGGVNFAAYNHDAKAAWKVIVNAFPLTSLNDLKNGGFGKLTARAPVVNSTILTSANSISGTSTEISGSIIRVFKNGSVIGSTVVNADGTWKLNNVSGLVLDNIITADVEPSSKIRSSISSPVKVVSGICTSPPPPTITDISSAPGGNMHKFSMTMPATSVARLRFTLYYGSGTFLNSYIITPSATASTAWETPGMTLPSGDNVFYATVTPINDSNNVIGCESLKSNYACFKSGQPAINKQVATISSVTYNSVQHTSTTNPTWADEVPTNLSSFEVTLSTVTSGTNGYVAVFINAVEQVSLRTDITTSTTKISIPIPSNLLKIGDEINVRTVWTLTVSGQITCSISNTPSNLLSIVGTTSAPTISSITTCGLVKKLSGTSTEPAGTILQFYTGGTKDARDGNLVVIGASTNPITATVSSLGNWTVDFTSVTGGGIPANTNITSRAKAAGKVRSVNSNVVSSVAAPAVPTGSDFTINNPILEPLPEEQLFTLRGTGPKPAGDKTYKVFLSIAGTSYPAVTTTTTGAWELTGISSAEIFPGAEISASFVEVINKVESCPSNTISTIVQCRAPSTAQTLTPSSSTVCSGSSFSVSLANSERNVSYALLIRTGTSPNFTYNQTGNSVIGNGGTITLISGAITSAVTIAVRARKISGASCDALYTNTYNLTVTPLPTTNHALTINTSSGCANSPHEITLSASQTNFKYQLINNITKQPITLSSGNSDALPGNGGNLIFRVSSVNATLTYGVRITRDLTVCTADNANTVTYTVTGSATNQAVTISTTQICAGGAVNIYVKTNNDGATYQIHRADGTTVGTSFTGNGSLYQRQVNPTTTTTYYVKATLGTCIVELATRVTVTIAPGGPTATAGPEQIICGQTSVTLQGNDAAPNTGRWSITSRPEGNTTATITDPESFTTTATGLTSGNYTFTWTVTSPTCGASTATTSIKINCPSTVNVAGPKYKASYKNGEFLSTASDVDKITQASNGIESSSIAEGLSALPPGTELSPNGDIKVINAQNLTPGTYRFTMLTTDQRGVTTATPMALTIYGAQPTVQPLPVELVYFTATLQNGTVNLQWLTASEKDNRHFEIERSADGKTFKSIGMVNGNGDSSRPIKYSFQDRNPMQGTAYYRLKQVDTDGKFTYSKVILVYANGLAADMRLQAYPNPFNAELNVTVTSPQGSSASLQLLDMQGRAVHSAMVQLETGINEYQLPLGTLRTGVYVLKLNGNGLQGAVKVLKQ
ncbi:T9SS type A sorting domain-containing protein [Pontibacter sp. CAU 1760]